MPKGLIFFCCACCILLLTIINLSIGPISSRRITGWGTLNCAAFKDIYKDAKKTKSGDELKYGEKWDWDSCTRLKGMHDMEYTAFIFDIVIGFVCGILGLLHYFDVKKDIVPKTGLIGLCCGAVGFILTFVYVIFNGLVYTKYDTNQLKVNGDGAYAERDGTSNNFKCIYYDKKNPHKVHATYSDLGKKQYNYNKDQYKTRLSTRCTGDSTYCDENAESFLSAAPIDCKYIYYTPTKEIRNKDISDRFLTTLILSLLVCLANIGLALFGFLLFHKGEF